MYSRVMCPRSPLPRLAGVRKAVALALLSVFAGSISASALLAQESGGSFGGGAWDEPAGGGSGGGGGGGGGSDWGSSGGTSGHDFAEEARRDEERRARDEERRRREDERRQEEERRRQEEQERLRQEEEARRLAERARKLALPPAQRAQELAWPITPPRPEPSTARDLAGPMAEAERPSSSWASPEPAPLFDPAPSATVIGPVEWPATLCCGLPLALLLLPLAWLLTQNRSVHVPDSQARAYRRSFLAPAPASASKPALALRVSAAFDWSARPELQRELAAMAQRHDLRARPGLHAAALEVSALLARHAPSARYVTWELATGDARSWFTNRTNDLRARFKAELVRNQTTQNGPAYTAKEHEGEGLVVVTVLVASKVRIPEPPQAFSAAALASVIQSIAGRNAGETLALEVIWSPAAEDDRMSSYELESHYPELQKISDAVGRMQCSYCRAPFPKELGRCPACGAPVA